MLVTKVTNWPCNLLCACALPDERADLRRRVPISRLSHGGRKETNLYGAGRVYGEAVRLTQGSPTDLMLVAAIGTIKPERLGDPEARWEKRVADSQGCTEDPRPVKHW